MKTTFLMLATLCVFVCAEHSPLKLHKRSISESTRSHNEYQRSDRNTNDNQAQLSNTENAPSSCVPGTRWRNNCNRCWCLASGAEACTRMRCPNFRVINQDGTRTVTLNSIQESGGKNSRVRRALGSGVNLLDGTTNSGPKRSSTCEEGKTWFKKCNRCRCANGRSLCTRMRCHDD